MVSPPENNEFTIARIGEFWCIRIHISDNLLDLYAATILCKYRPNQRNA